MKSMTERLGTAGTMAAGVVVTFLTFLAVRTWAGLYVPAPGAWLAGGMAAVLPAWFVNRSLTRSYQKVVDVSAGELESLFGTAVVVGLGVLGAMWLGLAGLPGTVAVEEALVRAGGTVGLLCGETDPTLRMYPRSAYGIHGIWAPALGSEDRAWVIARTDDGGLKGVTLPPRGSVLEAGLRSSVGRREGAPARVQLVPLSPRVAKSVAPASRDFLRIGAGTIEYRDGANHVKVGPGGIEVSAE